MSKKKKSEEGPEEAAGTKAAEAPPEPEVAATEAQPVALAEELTAAQATAAKNWDLYLRSQADLDNFRKRAQRDKEDLARFANESILRELLPAIDNLERALEHAEKSGTEGLLEGVKMTVAQFGKMLEKFGVTPVSAIGEPFDPARHEAIGHVESREVPANAVAQELQKGYVLNDRLLRPSLVLIAKAPTE